MVSPPRLDTIRMVSSLRFTYFVTSFFAFSVLALASFFV